MISKSSKPLIKGGVLAVLALALGACTAGSGTGDNPILRKFQWFSYLEGGDFKAACRPGSPSLYRMVYNGVYTEQVRMYEYDPRAATLSVRVVGPADLRAFSVSSLNDFLNPWRGVEAVTRLGPSDGEGLLRDLEASGAFGPPNVGEELSSRGFFWTIASCHDGAYHFTGFAWPGTEWERARFPGRLFALDQSGVAVNDPRRTKTGRDMTHNPQSELRPNQDYHVKVGTDGLARF